MMVDTYVYAHAFEGWVACPSCTSDEPYTRESGAVYFDGSHDHDASCEDGTGYCERQRGNPIFSYEDDGHGLTCEDCGEVIFDIDIEVEHNEYGHEAPEMADECPLCREYMSAHGEHADDLDDAEYFDDWCEDCADAVNALDAQHQAGEHRPDGSVLDCRQCQHVRDNEAPTDSLWEV